MRILIKHQFQVWTVAYVVAVFGFKAPWGITASLTFGFMLIHAAIAARIAFGSWRFWE